MFIVGLTGGIATGKSTVSQIFHDRGIPVIDADEMARKVVEPGGPAYAQLRAEFGAEYFDDENGGVLLRKKLGTIVFNDASKRRRLNAITHPAVRWEMLKQFLWILFSGHKFCVFDTPLLFEGGYDRIILTVLVVYCTPEQELERLIRRDECSEEEAKSRINSQMGIEEKKRKATILLDNTGTQEELRLQVHRVIEELESRWTPWVIRAAVLLFIGLISFPIFRRFY
ncbi:unnamed protein product, partial [Mesorhabditis belari]|uniref:Dephospho-CoA kinase n=1 Tax=Mesorhabditis belari TaxID=2138241 RepID=A0AAF3EA44_9BILA